MARQNTATIAIMIASGFLMVEDHYFLAFTSMITAGVYRLVIAERKEAVEQLVFTVIAAIVAIGAVIAYVSWLDRGTATPASPFVPAMLWLLVAFLAAAGGDQ